MDELMNDSAIGRLLEELSWEGNARKYRDGGRGLENVLVTEVFHALDLLPRAAFLGGVVRQAHGDREVLTAVADQMEKVLLLVLPAPPPVPVRGCGRLSISDAITRQLGAVHGRTSDAPALDDLLSHVDERLAWTTWSDVDRILHEGTAALPELPPSITAGVVRAAGTASRAIAWHS